MGRVFVLVALGRGATHLNKKKQIQISKSCKSYSTFTTFHCKISFSIQHKFMSYSKNNCHLFKKPCWLVIYIVMMANIVYSAYDKVWQSFGISLPFLPPSSPFPNNTIMDQLTWCSNSRCWGRVSNLGFGLFLFCGGKFHFLVTLIGYSLTVCACRTILLSSFW